MSVIACYRSFVLQALLDTAAGLDATSTTNPSAGADDAILEDIAAFRQMEASALESGVTTKEEEGGLLRSAVNVLGTVLSYNFLIILSFFAWFMAGACLWISARVAVCAVCALDPYH